MTTPPTPTTDRVRLTISVTPEVHATFQRLANAGSMSISRAMGEWLGDTLEAAEFMASTMERARAAPKLVARELHAYALGMADETGEVMRRIGKPGRVLGGPDAEPAAPPSGGPGAGNPPSSNTGGKGPPAKPKGRGGRS
jgi:hypothetical protein